MMDATGFVGSRSDSGEADDAGILHVILNHEERRAIDPPHWTG